MGDVTLQVLDGADRGKVFRNLLTPVTIGREEGNVVQLNDERISRFHIKIQEDLGKLDATTWTILPDSGLVAGQETGSWTVVYILDQKLWVDRCNPNCSIGLLSMWGIADDDPSPIDWSGNVAIQAFGMNAARPADSMGVAWFHTSLTSEFKQLVSPVLTLHDVTGVETYYNAAITPWFHLTGDLQVIEPADVNNDTALVLGLRANFAL